MEYNEYVYPIRPTYNEIHFACRDIANLINRFAPKFDRIIGLAKGGLVPTGILCQMINKPVLIINYSSKNGAGNNRNHDNILPQLEDKSILFVDDIIDSGKTMIELYQHYNYIPTKRTASLYYKESSIFEPEYYCWKIPSNAPWIIFPFEV